MKTKDLYNELVIIAKSSGIAIRRETGNFKSGYCLIDEKPIIILNKIASQEHQNRIIALGISYFQVDNQFIKPIIREFIDKEARNININLFEININTENSDGKKEKK